MQDASVIFMSIPTECESVVRQDFGPANPAGDFGPMLVHKLANKMSVPSGMDAATLQASGISSEVSSTHLPEGIMLQAISSKFNKVHSYESKDEEDPHALDVPGSSADMRVDNTNVGRICYPNMQPETEDFTNFSYDSSSTIAPVSMNSAIVKNYTLNVDASVGNIATIQSVSTSNQTLWLPTILATGTATKLENKPLEDEMSAAGQPQIIITSENYVPNSYNQSVRRNVSEAMSRSKSKVQILSNISLPKTSNAVTYTQQYVSQSTKDPVESALYGSPNHIYKLSASVTSVNPKHLNHSTNNKMSKNQTMTSYPNISSAVISQGHIKSVAYTHAFPKASNPKSMNKVNNGANLNAMVAGPPPNSQCHVLSRVVSGPKLAVQSGRKNLNTFGSKGSAKNSQNAGQKQSKSIKIIQQQTGSLHKSDMKNWPATIANSKSGPSYGLMESGNMKNAMTPKSSSLHKSNITSQKLSAKGEQRVMLQSPCGPVLISTAPISVSQHRAPHYVQSGQMTNLRYVQNYAPPDSSNASQMSSNQHLTAQILQSLSQPKLMLQTNPQSANHLMCPTPTYEPESYAPLSKPLDQRRHIFGDSTTLMTSDDLIGREERPNLSEELNRYPHDALALVMLDHTYALSVQKVPVVVTTTSSPPLVVSVPPITVTPVLVTAPPSPVKPAPHVTSTVQLPEYPVLQIPTAPSTPIASLPINSAPLSLTYKPALELPLDLYKSPLDSFNTRPEADDAGSAISSLDGQRLDKAGSDTETAPENEEEGKTRCICEFTHDDGYMICCDRCGEWQHVDCMGIDRNNIPDAYMCDLCQPRPVDRRRARSIQLRKREELSALVASDSDSSDGGLHSLGSKKKKLLTVTTYSDTSGVFVTTYNNALPVTAPTVSTPTPKKLTKRSPKRTDMSKKITKRKLTEKRVKRKKDLIMKRRISSNSASNQSIWHEAYEQAVTNHYSPELRAKIIKYSSKLGTTPNMSAAITAHFCTTVPHAGGKILITTRDLKENMPIIELRGKYMLSAQHRPQMPMSGRSGGQKPGPFVFFYRLPRDNTQICIDTRTFGNEARFVRRSCKSNAELQHCIVKGTLHVYLVTVTSIPEGTEITVAHDTNSGKQPCACGNPKHCKLNGIRSLRKSSEYTREKRTRNRRSSSSSPASPPPFSTVPALIREYPTRYSTEMKSPKYEMKSPTHEMKSPVHEMKSHPDEIKSPLKCDIKSPKYEMRSPMTSPVKFDMRSPKSEPEMSSPIKSWSSPIYKDIKTEDPKEELLPKIELKSEDVVDNPSMILETKEEYQESPEIKQEEIENEPEEVENIIEPPKELPIEEEPTKEEHVERAEPKIEEPQKPEERKKMKEDEKPVKPRAACHERSTRSSKTSVHNLDSLDDKTDDSQDKIQTSTKEKRKMTREERKMEAIMKAFERMEKAEQRKQEVRERQSKRRESDPVPPSIDMEDEDAVCASKKRNKRKGRARTTSQNTSRNRLNSADSDMVTSGDEAQSSPKDDDPPFEPRTLPPAPTHTEVGMSSTCMLVDAAVGTLENAFKLPKTKKTMANEWVGRSPEHTQSPFTFSGSPYGPALLSARSLESLVRVASTMIGDLSGTTSEPDESHSPPRTPNKKQPPKKAKRSTKTASTAPVAEPAQHTAQHSAKKRWLRQAISEESDSPTAESPPSEIVTPLKKRRLARESLSCDPPPVETYKPEGTFPAVTSEDSPVKDEGRESITRHCKMKRKFIESMYSDQHTEEHSMDSKYDASNIFLNMPRDEKFNMDIRRIIGVPEVETPLVPTKVIEDKSQKPMDVNDNEFHNIPRPPEEVRTATPMEIDMEITPLRIINEDVDKYEIHPEVITINSTETSGNSSPQLDEMDDIQKRIHSFHTENIQILKTRNKKPAKEKRKKVNLNFDLNMVDDQISILLRTEERTPEEVNGDIHSDGNIVFPPPENIPLPPVESIPLPATPIPPKSQYPHYIPLPEIPLPSEPMPTPSPEKVAISIATFADRIIEKLAFTEILRSPVITEPILKNDMELKESMERLVDEYKTPLTTCKENQTSVATFEDKKTPISTFEDNETPIKTLEENKTPIAIFEENRTPIATFEDNQTSTTTFEENTTPIATFGDNKTPIATFEDAKTPVVTFEDIKIPEPSVAELQTSKSQVSEKEMNQDAVETPEEKSDLTFTSRFSSGLFSGIFGRNEETNESVLNLNLIKSAIDRTTALESNILSTSDELKNVQEILSRVNNMDSNLSVLLSGVLKNSDQANKPDVALVSPLKPLSSRTSDPRLNPPPVDNPKPVRRKLSISEYRKRLKPASSSGSTESATWEPRLSVEGETGSDSSAAASRSPLRLDTHVISATTASDEFTTLTRVLGCGSDTGVFDAQPTLAERQREKLSERLRREFGLALPEDEEARPPHPTTLTLHHPPSLLAVVPTETVQSMEVSEQTLSEVNLQFVRPPTPSKLPRLDR